MPRVGPAPVASGQRGAHPPEVMSDPSPRPSPRNKRSPLRVIVTILLGIATLFIALVVLLAIFVRSAAFEAQVKSRILPQASEKLGRTISVESVGAAIFPPAIRVEGLQIAGSTQRPLLRAEQASARLALWPFLFSGGKKIELRTVEANSFEVNLVRKRDGSLDLPSLPLQRDPQRTFDLPSVSLRGGTLRLLDAVKGSELSIERIEAKAAMVGKALDLRTLVGEGYGGSLQLSGTKIDLSQATPRWTLRAKIRGIDLASLPAHSFDGSFDSTTEARGTGSAWEAIRRTLSGESSVSLLHADWRKLNFEAAILSTVVDQLRAVRLLAQPPKALPTGTKLGDVRQKLRIDDGWMNLEGPLKVRTTFGTATLEGRVALDQRLDLRAATQLPPSLLAELSGGKLKLKEPVPVKVSIAGTLSHPTVTSVDTSALAESIAKEGIRQLPKELPKKIPTPKLPIPKF